MPNNTYFCTVDVHVIYCNVRDGNGEHLKPKCQYLLAPIGAFEPFFTFGALIE
jgi:hypothetical protein